MIEHVLSLIGALHGADAVRQKKFDPPTSLSIEGEDGNMSFEAVEHREGLLQQLLETMGVIDPPALLRYTARANGVELSLRTGKEPAFTEESDMFIARGNILCVVRTYSKPKALLFWILGIATFMTIVGPIVALLLYLRQKHVVTFGFDTDSNIGLVITFVGKADIEQKLRPLWEPGKRYVSERDRRVSVPLQDSASVPAHNDWADPLPSIPKTYEVEPGKLLVRVNGQVQSLTKQELVIMARQGKLSSFDEVSTDGRSWLPVQKVRGLAMIR